MAALKRRFSYQNYSERISAIQTDNGLKVIVEAPDRYARGSC